MPLTPGPTLGPYEIEALLGAGGMGEVYKANDTRLHRTVAVKVLPEDVTWNPDLRKRFEREARAVAGLNHPHICTLHDIGSEDGTDFLVMEHLEGESLAQRLSKGALLLDEALKIAIEIADALDKAHGQGIVHRDLKPGNIMLTKTGAKLLDFGLAKLREAETEAGLTAMATESAPLTGEGTILGTFQYMAPEQLEGKEADSRTDIFAFGAVVYEMVTGRKAFEGTSQASLIGAILKDEPPAMSELQPLSPSTLEHAVDVCLAKDPDRRWQSAGDVGLELQWIAEGGGDDRMASALAASNRSSRWLKAGIAGVTLGLAAIGLAAWSLIVERSTLPSATPKRFTIMLPDSEIFPSAGGGTRVAVSPDGHTLVYNPFGDAGDQLFQRPINQFQAVPIIHTERGGHQFFSPDGQWVGFVADGALRKVALAGGPAQELTKVPGEVFRGASWGTNGMIVIGSPGGLVQVPEAGGEPVVIAQPESDGAPWHPQVLPGTGAILYTVSEPRPDAGELQVLLPETGERRSVLPNAVAGRVLDTGHLVFVRSGALWAVPFDQERLETVGNPIPVVDGVRVDRGGEVQYSVADEGTLVYLPGDVGGAAGNTLALVDRQGNMENVPFSSNDYALPRFSPDGTRIAVQINAKDGSNIFVYEFSNNRLRQLTFDGGEVPIWTPDGAQITFLAKDALWNIASDFSEEPQLLSPASEDSAILGPYSWSPDGRVLLYCRSAHGSGFDVMQLILLEESGVQPGPVLVAEYQENYADFSADGKWISFQSTDAVIPEVYVQPYPLGSGAKRKITEGGGIIPIWSDNGEELFYLTLDGRLSTMGIQTEPKLNWEDPQSLFELSDLAYEGPFANLDVTPDGQRFVLVTPSEQSEEQSREIRVVLNWFEVLKEKVPIR